MKERISAGHPAWKAGVASALLREIFDEEIIAWLS
jgi:hypothetical protein